MSQGKVDFVFSCVLPGQPGGYHQEKEAGEALWFGPFGILGRGEGHGVSTLALHVRMGFTSRGTDLIASRESPHGSQV